MQQIREIDLPVTADPVLRSRRLVRGSWRLVVGLWKFLAGVALTQSFLGAFAAAGWVYRAAQRTVQMQWWRMRRSHPDLSFAEFAGGSVFHRGLAHWPNWILANDRRGRGPEPVTFLSRLRWLVRVVFGSLWHNLKVGFQVVFNTAVLTLPGGVLMLFAWYFGWHNSFNKGYEQAAVGPFLGLAGIFAFIAAMYYVPLAQMRQASTGQWRSFYEFRLVWQLVRKKWFACFVLALLYAALSLPVTVLKTAPMFFPQINPALAELPPEKALQFGKAYYFYGAMVFFAVFVLLRQVAARIYARALLACVQSGALTPEALAENEWESLHRLGLLEVQAATRSHALVRTASWLGTRFGRVTTGFALFVVWFAFISQVYVSEFFMKSELGRAWLNQPLVQLPWFNYIPRQLWKEGSLREETARPLDLSGTTARPGQ